MAENQREGGFIVERSICGENLQVNEVLALAPPLFIVIN